MDYGSKITHPLNQNNICYLIHHEKIKITVVKLVMNYNMYIHECLCIRNGYSKSVLLNHSTKHLSFILYKSSIIVFTLLYFS